jgi:hypothetical protein
VVERGHDASIEVEQERRGGEGRVEDKDKVKDKDERAQTMPEYV